MALDDFPTDVPMEDGGSGSLLAAPPTVPSMRQPEHVERLYRWADPEQTINLCDELIAMEGGEQNFGSVGNTVVRQYELDEASRSEWKARTKAAMDLAMQVTTEKSSPWPNASNVIYPLISTAAIQFSARAYPAIIAGPGVVKGVVIGDDKGVPVIDPMSGVHAIGDDGLPVWEVRPGVKQERADRIGEHMSWQLLEEQTEWEPETDKLLVIVPIVGCAFRKSYFDNDEDRNAAVLVLAENLVINYRAKSLETAPRVTEIIKLYPVEIQEAMRAGVFLQHDFGWAPDGGGDEDAPHEFLEQHRRIDLDHDGYPEPYIVTVHKATFKVVRIVPRFDAEGIILSGMDKKVRKIKPIHYYTQYDFMPNPDGGIYGVGLGQLLNPINEAVNTTLNQIFDAGTLQNNGGGFIGKGLSMHSGSIRFKPGEYKVVNALGSTVRDAIVPLTFPGPSPVLFQLLGFLVDAGKETASNTEVLSGNQTNANVPATTTLALIEQGLKVFTAVYKRIYRSLKKEFDKQKRLNRLYLDRESAYRFRDEWKVIQRQDYVDGSGVEPISDPAMVSDMQQLARAEALKEYVQHPLVNTKEALTRIFTAMKQDNIDKLILEKAPVDPEVAAKSIEMALRQVEVKAKAVKEMALAIKALAEADVIVQEEFRSWAALQLEGIKVQMEGLENGEGAGGQGNPGAGLPGLAAPPGNAGLPAISP